MRNGIIINGTRHVLVTEDGLFGHCRRCSIAPWCGTDPICQTVFGRDDGHFEIEKKNSATGKTFQSLKHWKEVEHEKNTKV